jgi:imidazolonepropionase-like amidohydrolase
MPRGLACVLLGTLGSGLALGLAPAQAFSQPQGQRPASVARAPVPGAPVGVTAFVDVAVVPMDTERVLPNQTVVIEGGRITALGPSGKVPVPAGAVRIDGRGKYLMPGLTDMHVHRPSEALEAKEEFQMLSMGITAFRDLADGSTGVSVEQMQRLRQHFATAPTPTLRPFLSRGGRPPATPSPDSLGAYVAAAKAAGYDHIVLPFGAEVRTPADQVFFDSIVAATRRAGLPLSAHTHALSREGILALGTTGGAIDHVATLVYALGYRFPPRERGERPAPIEVSMEKVRELGTAMQRAGVWFVPTLACETVAKSTLVKDIPQIVKTLHDAGVKLFLAGDEANVQQDLAAFVRAGLTPYQALVAGTRNVAEYFGRLNDLGTVAVGKRADLVLLYGNPLANIGHMWELAGVMSEGRWLDRAGLDQDLLASKQPRGRIFGRISSLTNNSSRSRGLYPMTTEQKKQFGVHMRQVGAFQDSLEVADPTAQKRILQRITDELGQVRRILTPEQQMVFDPLVRMWQRAEARMGNQVSVPGVTSTL